MIELLESEGSFGGLLFLLGEFYPLRLFKFEFLDLVIERAE